MILEFLKDIGLLDMSARPNSDAVMERALPRMAIKRRRHRSDVPQPTRKSSRLSGESTIIATQQAQSSPQVRGS